MRSRKNRRDQGIILPQSRQGLTPRYTVSNSPGAWPIMRSVLLFAFPLVGMCLASGVAGAHYHILLPDKLVAQTDQAITVTLRFGHPFEHQMFATQKPRRAVVVTPEENLVELNARSEQV